PLTPKKLNNEEDEDDDYEEIEREAEARVGPLSGKDPLVIVVADTDCLPHVCCGSALSACVLKHPGCSQLISGLSDGSKCYYTKVPRHFCFFRGYLLLSRRFVVPVSITDIKYVLTQKGLDIFCQSFHIPDDVHPQLPSTNQTIHEMPTGKIGVYTRFFEFANFRIPLSTFLVSVLRHYRINLSQLSVIAAAKVSHFEILCHVHGMDLFAFIQVADPTKVKVGEQKRAEGEARLLYSTVGRVVPLLPVASAHAESELEASVERLFDEGGSVDQEEFRCCGGQEAKAEIATGVRIVTDENVKLRGDYGASSEAAICGKSPSALRELLASSMLNVEVGVAAVATLPMVTSSVSATLEHESGVPADSITGLISVLLVHLKGSSAVVPPVMTEALVTSHAVTVLLVPKTGAKVTSPVHTSLFQDSDSTKTVKADAAGPSYSIRQDLSMGSRELDVETLHQVLVPQWNIREMDYHHLFTEFNVVTARQACLNTEVRMWTEYCLSERKRLESECEKQADLLKARDEEIENLKAQLLLKETEAAEAACFHAQVSAAEAMEKMRAAEIDALKWRNVALENEKDSLDGKKDGLVDQVHALEITCSGLRDQVSGFEQLKEQIEEFQDAQMNIVGDKVAKLDTDLLEMALHLEKKFYPHLLTTISGRRWLLTHGLKLAVVKCLNSQEYLSDLGAAISRAIEKGMKDGLSVGIDHGKAGRSLADVVAYNPAAEANYNSALRRLHEVDFSLLAELKSHKDASVEDIMNLFRLEGPLDDAPRMSDLQPHVDQLMLHVHRSEDQVVLGERSLSFALSVTHSRVERIRENVAAERSALIDVWAPLVDPLSVKNLTSEAGTSDGVPATTATTSSLSTTFASASFVSPITIEDYEIVVTEGLKDAQGNG
nr:transposase (putative), gypsy type [Tanacetum cinerariifolium]